jgi:hypothetical protein
VAAAFALVPFAQVQEPQTAQVLQHWVHLRTTNPIESTFATVRHRTKGDIGGRFVNGKLLERPDKSGGDAQAA